MRYMIITMTAIILLSIHGLSIMKQNSNKYFEAVRKIKQCDAISNCQIIVGVAEDQLIIEYDYRKPVNNYGVCDRSRSL